MDDVQLWMMDPHLGRRSLSDFQPGVMTRLRQTITELSAENAALKAKLADLTACPAR